VTIAPTGISTSRLSSWLSAVVPELVERGPWSAEVISGGLSNITYRLRFSGDTLILRRPPFGHLLPKAHDMKREYRLLSALADGPVPLPTPVALCTDASVLGADFYLMREVPGQVLRSPGDTDALDRDQRAALAADFVRVLVALHSLDPDAVGLGDFGRRGGYCLRQVETWQKQWHRSRTRELPDVDRLFQRLRDSLPASGESTLVHGDYRLDNLIVGLGSQVTIRAVLDWELATIGDPLADLGLALVYWHDVGDAERAEIPVSVHLTDKPGFPTGRQLAEAYASQSGRDIDQLAFYVALGAMKLAVILDGVTARYSAGQMADQGRDGLETAVSVLASRGLALLR
jgi:aminoglycoside phosphotransferase (APT) family kinase protein